MNSFRPSCAQRGRGDVRAMALAIVGVNATIGVGGRRGCVKSCDPFLVVVTGGIAVRFIVDVIEIIEGTVLVVNAGVEDGHDHTLAVVTSSVCAGGVNVGGHGPSGFRGDAIEWNHHVLHLNNDHAVQEINVHQRTDRDFVNHHGVN